MTELADEAVRMLVADGVYVRRHRMPSFEDLFPEAPDVDNLYEKEVGFPDIRDVKAHCTIMHSSGTLRVSRVLYIH